MRALRNVCTYANVSPRTAHPSTLALHHLTHIACSPMYQRYQYAHVRRAANPFPSWHFISGPTLPVC